MEYLRVRDRHVVAVIEAGSFSNAAEHPHVTQSTVSAEFGFESDLMQGLFDGRPDIGVMYTPQSRPGMVVEKLLTVACPRVRDPGCDST